MMMLRERDRALLNTVHQEAFDHIYVFDDAGHEVAGSALVKPPYGQALKACIHVAPHVVDDVLFE